jgi:hypothetical protein
MLFWDRVRLTTLGTARNVSFITFTNLFELKSKVCNDIMDIEESELIFSILFDAEIWCEIIGGRGAMM